MNKVDMIKELKCMCYEFISQNVEDDGVNARYVQGLVEMANEAIMLIEREVPNIPDIKPMEFTFDMKDIKVDNDKINAVLYRDTGIGRSE